MVDRKENREAGKRARDNLRGQKSLGPLKMSLEMAHKVIVPPKKNYIPQFLLNSGTLIVITVQLLGIKVFSYGDGGGALKNLNGRVCRVFLMQTLS
jgi:hypothetical protein